MKDSLREKTKRLMKIPGISGQETEVVRFLMEQLAPGADDIFADSMGNLFALRRGSRPGPKFMLAAHSDQLGAVVRYVDPSGFLRFEKVGGILDSLLVGRKVWVGGVPGIVGLKPGHYQTEEEKRRVPQAEDMYIDVGAGDADGVRALGIDIGTPVTYMDEMTVFADGNRFAGAGLDDRAGCAVLWQVFEELSDGDFGGEFWGVITVQEEVGLRGAGVAGTRLAPDFALALDTIPCGGTPDVRTDQLHTDIGLGPVFALVSGRRGQFTAHPKVRKMLTAAAEKCGAPYQPMVFAGGNNDASSIQLAGEGVAAASVTLPRRYSHSPVEMGDFRDMVAATNILETLVRDMETADGFDFI